MKYRVIFFTGAGISVDSGIPTFQEKPEIRNKLSRDFANEYPEAYRKTIRDMVEIVEKAEPNAAHKAIAESGFPVITMNIDGLHRKAGSEDVLEIHGVLPTMEQVNQSDFPLTYEGIVLYGDLAPKYTDAVRMVKHLKWNDSYFVIVGTSFYTGISTELKRLAERQNARIITINENASTEVPRICEVLRKRFEHEIS